jgi:hypothetical protein
MHSMREGLQQNLIAITFGLMLAVLWLLLHGYEGFAGDAQIYAFQALARIHPALSGDLYLQNTSQDLYTIFSPIYARFIDWWGLENAARLLTLFFSVWFIVAAWHWVAALTTRHGAWLAVAFLLIAGGAYGGSGIFYSFEHYLTPRLFAQSLVVTALACQCRGRKVLPLALCVAALLVHPLMAFPGILLLLCLWLPPRVSVSFMLGGVLTALALALLATTLPGVAHVFVVMDEDWLQVVRERSQFLFLQLWSMGDWDTNLRPLVDLLFMALVWRERQVHKLLLAALLVGISGLSVALIASLIGPVAILVQGQAWRWVWIGCIISVLWFPTTLWRVWKEDKCGPVCAALYICGLIAPPFIGTASVLLAVAVWLARRYIGATSIPYYRAAAVLIGLGVLSWIVIDAVAHRTIASADFGNSLGTKVAAALLCVGLWLWIRDTQSSWLPLGLSAVLLISAVSIGAASFKHARSLDLQIEAFSDWSDAIAQGSTVFIAPARDVGTFVWFTLGRLNYLALDQSAGVVFSRETALEVRRRSENVLPLTDPTWKILSRIRRRATGQKIDPPTRPLTAQSLIDVCKDPKLGFVISPENVGFDPKRHTKIGPWKDWNLYDCTRVRS